MEDSDSPITAYKFLNVLCDRVTLETNSYWITHSNLLFLSASNFWDKPTLFPHWECTLSSSVAINLSRDLCGAVFEPQVICSACLTITPSQSHHMEARSYFFMGERIGKFVLKSSIHHFVFPSTKSKQQLEVEIKPIIHIITYLQYTKNRNSAVIPITKPCNMLLWLKKLNSSLCANRSETC